jgi:hypothetical protein
LRRQPLARSEPEQHRVHEIDEGRHGRDHQPAERADDDGEHHQAGFPRSYDGA